MNEPTSLHPAPAGSPEPAGAGRGPDPAGPRERPVRARLRARPVVVATLAVLVVAAAVLAVLRPWTSSPAPQPGDAAAPAATGDPLGDQIAGLQQHLRTRPDDAGGWATLGIDYVQRAKDTVDPAYYPKAEGVLQRSLQLDASDNFVAMAGMADLRSAQHRFADALVWAQRADSVNHDNAAVQGGLADAYTQLGRYDEAAAAVQRMVDLQPGTPSLARAEYVVELRGDVDSARALMQRALQDATSPAQQAFAHYHLAELALSGGDAQQALAEDEAGLRADPGYPDLLEGKAKAEAALGRQQDAERDFAAVIARVPQPQYVIEAGEYLQSLGRTAEAQRDYDLFAAENALFESNGVQPDVDPTLFYADHGDPARALRYAEAGIAVRPFLDMDDAYAWALHVNHRDAEALTWSDRATATGMRNALFAYHRGMIEKSLGRPADARRDLSAALALAPAFNPVQAPVARQALAELGGPG
jgi:tetratricopeptide (TPR) repeat protein